MTGKERAVKWCKGIPELESLTLITQERICTKVAKQLLVIMMTVIFISVTIFIYLSFQYPELAAYMDRINTTLLNHMTNRASRNSLAGGLFDVFSALVPLLFVLFGPPLLVFFTLKKPLSKREARKTLATWRLETDSGMRTNITFVEVQKAMIALEIGDIYYFILYSPQGLMESPFMQTMREKTGTFILEVSKGDEKKSTLFSCKRLTREEVLSTMKEYRERHIIPLTDTWEVIGTYDKVEAERAQAQKTALQQERKDTFIRLVGNLSGNNAKVIKEAHKFLKNPIAFFYKTKADKPVNTDVSETDMRQALRDILVQNRVAPALPCSISADTFVQAVNNVSLVRSHPELTLTPDIFSADPDGESEDFARKINKYWENTQFRIVSLYTDSDLFVLLPVNLIDLEALQKEAVTVGSNIIYLAPIDESNE